MGETAVLAGMLLVQMVGAYTAIHYFFRLREATPSDWYIWLVLTSLIAGGTGFTSHVMTLAVLPQGRLLVLDPAYVALSFGIALTSIGFSIVASRLFRRIWATVVFGIMFHTMVSIGNLGVVLTAQAQGTITVSTQHVIAAIVLTFPMALLGGYVANAAERVKKAILGATSLGFMTPVQDTILMTGLTVDRDPSAAVPFGLAMDTSLLVVLICASFVIVLVGGAGLIIERKMDHEANMRYRELAYTDPLTGLQNRIGMNKALGRLLKVRSNREGAFAFFVFDLDKFKAINDNEGHAAGDAVLTAVAQRLQDTLPARASIGRFGGDEFVALVPLSTRNATQYEVNDFAERLRDNLNRPVSFNGKELPVGASIGISIAPDHATAPDDLIVAADIALYAAKEQRGSAVLYTEEMGAAAKAKAMLDDEIRRALRSNEFVLFFQSQFDLKSERTSGFEALIRWQHPTRGLLAPDAFIPHSEGSALINEIGTWVLNEACGIASEWPENYRVSVNVAARQLALPDFVEQVSDALWSAGLDATRLELELTEASVIEDKEQALRIMQELKALGVRIVMDDYGTGYASLAALRTFPFDKLKIDRSFMDGLPHDAQAVAIIRSTLLLTDALNIPVTAEGVETQQHVDFLTAAGCHEAQGFFYARPQPADVIKAAMTEPKPQAKRG